VDPAVAQAFKLYDEAMRLFNQQSYRRARELFEKVVLGPSRELAERARVHIAICDKRAERQPHLQLRTADDYYHFAVSQINLGNYEEARGLLEKARKLAPKADYVFYALASVASLSGEADEALNFLAQAIKLRPENRYHARNDADFKLLEDDSRFLALVSPERASGPGFRSASA
jgi:tetratricopeptide (TPR) repeat protein